MVPHTTRSPRLGKPWARLVGGARRGLPWRRGGIPALALWVLAALGGCATTGPDVQYYVLAPLPSGSNSKGLDRVVGVGPVDLPQYLNRPQIVTRAGENQLTLAEFHRWAEPLEVNVAAVLAQNLTALLDGTTVAAFPWPAETTPDYRIRVTISRFEGDSDGNVSLVARWQLVDLQGQELQRGNALLGAAFVPPTDGEWDYGALVGAMNRVLGELSQDLARALRRLADPRGSPP
ncbi:MAG: membrane integrity-associated transporter subunit PqiC [Candidatus Competibacterales bacterium]